MIGGRFLFQHILLPLQMGAAGWDIPHAYFLIMK
jgi:hypothetical protein